MTTANETPDIQPVKRPALLTAACILSFIGSGAGLFSYLLFSLSYSELLNAISESGLHFPGTEIILEASRGFFVSGTLLYAASLLGVSLMWRLRKVGFHLYVAAQLLLILHPYLYLEMPGWPYLQVIFTGIFIFIYSLHLKIFR
jgi:hypothetical protein